MHLQSRILASSPRFRRAALLLLSAALPVCAQANAQTPAPAAFGINAQSPAQLAPHSTLSLAQALHAGLDQAPEARESADRVEFARARVTGARVHPNPRLYLQSEDLRPWASDFSFENDTEDYGYLDQTFELDGKRGKRIRYAEGGLRRTEAEHRYQLLQLAGSIAGAYWTASATRAMADEWQAQLSDMDRLVHYQSDRVDAGAAAGVDLIRTQLERDRIALSLAQAQRDAEAAAIELARRTALPAARTATLTEPLERERPIVPRPAADAVEARPDVLAAREAVGEAEADLRLQHADALPNLDLIGGYKRNSGFNTVYGALQYDLPFFNRNQGGIATASAGRQLAEDQLAYTRLAAGSELASTLASYRREQALVTGTLPGMRERAAQNAAILSDAYRSGGADLLRFLDAERVLLDTRLLAIQTWAEYQRSVVALHLAYGDQP